MIKHSIYLFLIMLSSGLISAQEELVLDATWEIIFDNNNEGKQADWVTDAGFVANTGRRPIAVPSVWETIEKDYEGVAIYRQEFRVPKGWENKVMHLQFEAVNYLAEVWLNDEVVGFHEGGFTPFEFRVDEMAKAGETNVLIVRVVGPITLSDKEVDGIKPMETPQWRAGITGGIWQSVRLVATDDIYLDDVYIQPSLADESVSFDLTLDQAGQSNVEATIAIVITEADGGMVVIAAAETGELHPGKNKQRLSLNVPNANSWSPGDPHLYHAEVKISSEGKISDSHTGRFGFREFTIRDNDFYLNGKPIYLKATFFEGLYPNKVAYPDDEAMVREEIRLAKDAGFNMISPWRKPSSDLYPDTEAFYLDMQKIHGTANKRMIEGFRANPAVDGYCIHALSAGDWILGGGLIDLWRQPKTYAFEATKDANQPRILSIRTLPRNVYADEGMELEVIGINDLETLPARRRPSLSLHLRGRKSDGLILWSCIPHLVRDHPVFAGLPVDTMMRNVYEHVWARQTLLNLRGLKGETPEVLVASIGYQWFSRGHQLHYSGPGALWWGADVAIVPVGKGRCVVSQLQLLLHLGTDPAADLIWNNLLRFLD
jgi:hypothetical protein